ncbi:MAG TPA: cyclic nucleotide-binding domain-containing protein [Candidatus Eisenbacteria bacterium]|nr:cyclic nucleotide-binding domain-containing protein [Candidatus Eisenbacteria bacterium]
MSAPKVRTIELDPRSLRWALIFAQVLALFTYVLGVGFLFLTNGGTLFLFSVAAPTLTGLATLLLVAVAVYRYLRRNSLFAFALFEPGDIIVQQGDEGDFAYFIQKGEVEVVRRDLQGETLITTLGTGQHFGELALIENVPHEATVRAKTRVRLAMLGRRKFMHMLRFVGTTQEDIMSAFDQKAALQALKRAKASASGTGV